MKTTQTISSCQERAAVDWGNKYVFFFSHPVSRQSEGIVVVISFAGIILFFFLKSN